MALICQSIPRRGWWPFSWCNAPAATSGRPAICFSRPLRTFFQNEPATRWTGTPVPSEELASVAAVAAVFTQLARGLPEECDGHNQACQLRAGLIDRVWVTAAYSFRK